MKHVHNACDFLCIKCFLYLFLSATNCERVAIIGAGIGGTSSSYFLLQQFGKSVETHVFESTMAVGGRLAIVNVGGNFYESGGSIIHPKNKYMVQFKEIFGLKKLKEDSSQLGIFNGEQFIFKGSSYRLVTFMKLLWRYGYDLIRLNNLIDKFLDRFSRIYDYQKEGYAFATVDSLLTSMSPKLQEMMDQNLWNFLIDRGFNTKFINELVEAVMLVNYGQSIDDMQAFVGLVSLAGAQSGLWAIEGGNKRVPDYLLNSSSASVHQSCQVAEVIQFVEEPLDAKSKKAIKYAIRCDDDNSVYDNFDYVILATPLISNDPHSIKFSRKVHNTHVDGDEAVEDLPLPAVLGSYHQTVASFVQGDIAPEAFNTEQAVPNAVLTCNHTLFYCSVSELSAVQQKANNQQHYLITLLPPWLSSYLFDLDSNRQSSSMDDKRVWKIFSREPLSNSQTNFLFRTAHAEKSVVWQAAYPEYRKRTELAMPLPFELSTNLFYLNSIEWAASAIEMSVISARNIVNLINSRVKNQRWRVDNKELLDVARKIAKHEEL